MKFEIYQDKTQYLSATPTIDCNHPIIKKKSLALIQSCQTETDKAKQLFKFVRDNI